MIMHSLHEMIYSFFRKYLADQKGVSQNTIISYSTCVKLLLNFACSHLQKSIEHLDIEDIDAQLVLDFLDYLEGQRENLPQTRNNRLAAIKSFFRFLALQEPELTAVCVRICSISSKKTSTKVPDSLDEHEIKAFLNAPDLNNLLGIRDRALLLLLYNTGARAQEVVNLCPSDLRLESPEQVRILGKGNKERLIPIWPETVTALKQYIEVREGDVDNKQTLFLNQKKLPLTRFGLVHLIRKYLKQAQLVCPSLNHKKISPHSFRHTCALHLLTSGVNLSVIRDWLGHVDINTTHHYLHITMDLKLKALSDYTPPSFSDETHEKWKDPHLLAFLEGLSKCRAVA